MPLNASLDQAAGLRRMLAAASTRHISFLSAIPAAHKNAILLNLAAALVQLGSEVHVLDASQSAKGIAATVALPLDACLADSVRQNGASAASLFVHAPGIYLSKLSSQPLSRVIGQQLSGEQLSQTLHGLKPDIDFRLVDTDLAHDNPFVLTDLAKGDVVVIVAPTADSIKNAYLQIKSLHNLLGRRPYHVLVVDATQQQARLIIDNMSNTANQFLAVPLISLGSVPADPYFTRAVALERPVIEAFPAAAAATAFRGIAGWLAGQHGSGFAAAGNQQGMVHD